MTPRCQVRAEEESGARKEAESLGLRGFSRHSRARPWTGAQTVFIFGGSTLARRGSNLFWTACKSASVTPTIQLKTHQSSLEVCSRADAEVRPAPAAASSAQPKQALRLTPRWRAQPAGTDAAAGARLLQVCQAGGSLARSTASLFSLARCAAACASTVTEGYGQAILVDAPIHTASVLYNIVPGTATRIA